MIRLPSIQKPHDAFFSKDPAFEQAPAAPDADASDEDRAKHAAALETYQAKIKAARDTGDWSPLTKDGEVPTKFVIGQIDRTVWRAIDDRMRLAQSNARYIGTSVMLHLLFRLAVREVVGIEAIKVKRQPDPRWDDWVMMQADVVTLLDAVDEDIVSEVGMQVFWRLQDGGPFGRSSSKG